MVEQKGGGFSAEQTSGPEDLEGILATWGARVNHYNKTTLYKGFFCNEPGAVGEESLRAISLQYGKEKALELLGIVDGLNLETQARLLSLGEKDAPILIKAYPKRQAPWESMLWRLGQRGYPSLQERVYKKVVGEMLKVKFSGQDTPGLLEKLPSSSRYRDGFFGTVELALQKGPNLLLEAFSFIPPIEIRPSRFDKRLEIEKRARKKGIEKVGRVYFFTGSVQGVGFRNFCQVQAFSWGGIICSAENMEDGSVRMTIQGYPEILDIYIADFYLAAEEARYRFAVELGKEDQ